MTPLSETRRANVEISGTPKARAVLRAAVAATVILIAGLPAAAQLSVEIVNGYNLVVDSNVTAPSTYAPGAAYIGARVCNTSGTDLSDVFAYVGNFGAGTPGTFPLTGSYALTLESGSTGPADATRYIGNLGAGECRIQYWLISYPQCADETENPPCTASITGGIKPDDDPVLNYDVWATGDTDPTAGVTLTTTSSSRTFTLRNEISAAANKIWPNTTSKVPDEYLAAIQSVVGWGTLGPDGQPLSSGNPIFPGQRVITTQGIWYDLGNVGQGFDNDGDLIPDQNAWLQPVGDPSQFDAGCFRMVNVYGIVIVKLKSGGELLIPFQNELYHEHIPDNTGVVGLVYYQYIATGEGCNANMTPYQEAASGFDNEKFSADYGLSLALQSGSFGAEVSFSKTDGAASASTGSTLTYTISATNDTTPGVNLGAPDIGAPLVFRDSVPAGTTFVALSADDNPAGNLLEPTGTGTFTQGYTDIDGNLDQCTIGYNIASSSWVVLYSNDDGSTWSTTEPAGVTDLQWMLLTTLALDGGHDGTNCVAGNGTYDDGTVDTSLPAGKSISVNFQVQVAPTGGPVVCNSANLGFGGAISNIDAEDCTIVTGNNSLSGTVFRDNAAGGGIYGNGTQDGTETGIGAGVNVSLYYDLNGDGQLDGGDILYGTTTTNGSGDYSFGSLPDGPYLVIVEKYDNVDDGDSATDTTAFATTGWGNTTFDPNLPLTTDTGILKLNETLGDVMLAVNLDLDKNNAAANSLTSVDFGFAPPFRLTKNVQSNPDVSPANDVADSVVSEGKAFNYTILMENLLPSVGVQGPTGCQYTVWAAAGATGSNPKDFANPTNAFGATTPDGSVATAPVIGGGLRWIYGTSFGLASQLGSITKVEGLFFGYFDIPLTDDFLNLAAGLAGTGVGSNGITGTLSTRTIDTALIDSYVGPRPDFDPNSAISWDLTATRPGGGSWAWTDFPGMFLQVNPSKTASADAKNFALDAIGVRVTTDQDCEAGPSTTLSPVPLEDTYDFSRFDFVSASPAPTSVNTTTGVIRWNDVGPILPGTSKTVIVTLRPKNVATGTLTGSCVGVPPASVNGTGCNYAQSNFDSNNVMYADGRTANNGNDKIAVSVIARGEIRGTVYRDVAPQTWPLSAGDTGLPNIPVTLWGCVRADGVTLETESKNKSCADQLTGNFWKALSTAATTSAGTYEFIGLELGHYLIEIGDNDGAPGTGNTSPFGGTQTTEGLDTQTVTGGNANGQTCGTCNNTWGDPGANLNTLNQIVGEEIINGVDFGYDIPNAVIYGNVWHDIDGDATQDPGELGQSGFTVQLYSDPNADGDPSDGTVLATTTSDANGNYSFGGLASGSYVVVVTPLSLPNKTWVETVESTGGTGSLNNQIPVTILAGAISGPHTFGYTQEDTADIGDSLFIDFDGDGVRDAGEAGIPNVTVSLYRDVDRDGIIDAGVDTVIATTETDASGQYLFQDYPAGSYIVQVDTADTEFPTNVTATADPDLLTGRIGDFVWYDADGDGVQDAGENGIAGVTVSLYRDANGNGLFDDVVVASTTTDVNGNYLFTGLSAGGYFIDIDTLSLPSGDLAPTTADPTTILLTLATNSTAVLTADAGYSPAANFAIGNRVWHDDDGDNVQDPGEVGIPNIDVTVTGTGVICNPTPCTTTTDAAGFWIVTGLATTETYAVSVDDTDLPRDFTLTAGTDPRNVLIGAVDNMGVDFGYNYTGAGTSPTANITGRVFLDADGDLAYDGGEERSGTTVNLVDAGGNVVATTTTNGTGNYTFTGAFIGSYTVQSIDSLGVRYSSVFLSAAQLFSGLDVIYSATSTTMADGIGSVSIDGVHDNLLMDFGYQRFQGSIGDTIYHDVNGNATQDTGEPGLDGVTVRLYTAGWNDANMDGLVDNGETTGEVEIATTTTTADDPLTVADESGKYLFANLGSLAASTYYLVRVDTGTLPGSSQTLIADPDTDGTPCTVGSTVCDHQQLVVAYSDGNNYLGADFGYQITGSGFATIGDSLWIDTNGNNSFDTGEPGIPYVTVFMDTNGNSALDWADGNGNGVWDSGEGERWVETDANGFYVFTDVADSGTPYNVTVLTSDGDWPAGLPTTPTYESGTASLNNTVQVTVTGGAVSAKDGAACSSCNLTVDFGYRYSGTNTVSGTICTEGATIDGFCGADAMTYSGVGTGESALSGVQVLFYQWNDGGTANVAWDAGTGAYDGGDTFTFLGSTVTDSNGDYSMSGLPGSVLVLFAVSASQNLLLSTDDLGSSVEGAATSHQIYDGRSTFDGNSVTVVARQALDLSGTAQDLDFAFDGTLGGTITWDFGDLPSVYANTLLASGGARHLIGSISLGTNLSSKLDGTEAAGADADADDDGVSNEPTTFGAGDTVSVDVSVTGGPGWLGAWIDWNGDGDFADADETFIDQAVNGSQTITFPVPTDFDFDGDGTPDRATGANTFFVRFRVYPTRPTLFSSTGTALDSSFQPFTGEVEDYLWNVNVTPAVLTSFVARENGRSVIVEWTTGSEIGTAGFYLRRWEPETREWVSVNDELLPAILDTPRGGRYRYADHGARYGAAHRYELVEVEMNGSMRTFGPYDLTREPPGTVAPEQDGLDWTADAYHRDYAKAAHPLRGAAAPPRADRQAKGGKPNTPKAVGAKIAIAEAGIQFVSVAEVESAGFAVDKTWLSSSRNLYELSTQGELVSFIAAPDASGLYFYGEPLESIFASHNVYWLGESKRNSPRMKVRKQGQVFLPSGRETFRRTARFEEDRIPAFYGTFFDDPESSFWTWDYFVAGQGRKSFTFRADGIDTSSSDAVLTVRLLGTTDTPAATDHHVVVRVNGVVVGEAMWAGMKSRTLTLSVPSNTLGDGANTLELEGRLDTGAPYSVVNLDSFDLEYQSLYRSRMNELEFAADGNPSILVSGFTRPDVMVFDISDPRTPVYIEASAQLVGNSYGVALTPETPSSRYIALTPDAASRPAGIKPDTPSDLASPSNLGEYLIVTTRELAASAQRLADHRADLTSKVVDIEDVWDEFNYGVANPQALRSFLEHASNEWARPPRYVVLAGDGTFDYKGFLGHDDNLVPARTVATPFGLFPSDNWFANFDAASAAPEIAIGRLPAGSSDELDRMIDRIIARERTAGEAWRSKVLVLADNADQAGNFPADSDQVAALLPSGSPIEKVYLSNLPAGIARNRVVDALNLGAGIVSYIGHGGFDSFASEGMLRIADLQRLTNTDRPTVVTGMTCNVGNFSYPGYVGLSESLMLQEAGGAAAVWAATGMSQNEHAAALARAFYQIAAEKGDVRIGDVILEALRAYEGERRPAYIIDIYGLLGDPAMKLH